MSGPFEPDVRVEPVVPAAPGQSTTVTIAIRNTAPEPRRMLVTVVGLDTAWAGLPWRTEAVPAGEELTVTVPLHPPLGSPAGRYPFVVMVQSVSAAGGDPDAGPATQVDASVVVGDASRLTAVLAPAEPEGVYGRRITVTLSNTGTEPVDVTMSAQTALGLRLKLRSASVSLPARGSTDVRGRLSVDRARMFGQSRRMPFILTAQGHTTPLRFDGVFVSRPVFSTAVTRSLAFLVVVGVWASAAILGIGLLSSRANNAQLNPSKSTSAGKGGSGGSGSGGSGSGANGSGGSGSGANGSGGSGSSGSSSGGGATVAGARSQRVNGTVTGPQPGGVTVTMRPTSLVDEATVGAGFVGLAAKQTLLGKVPATLAAAVSFTPATLTTTSQPDGTWAFSGITQPGYYLLTFSKPGFETQKYVVDLTTGTPVQPLTVPMKAGSGSLSGAVTAGGKALGDVSLTLTDGTVTVTTGTPSTGAVGQWSVSGLNTPDSYLVTASLPGYGTASQLVSLGAGQSLSNIDFALFPGTEGLLGTVSGPDVTGAVGGVGGATVTATNGTVTRTATTVTTGPVGSFSLPDLPAPGSYTVSITAPGYAPLTEQVTLDALTAAKTVTATLTASTGVVTGTITDGAGAGVVGAGIVLTGTNGTYKTTTVSAPAGTFRITGVVPGSYVLTAEKFAMVTDTQAVTAAVGSPAVVTMALAAEPDNGLPTSSHIQGKVVDARTGGVISCPSTVPAASCVVTVSTVDHRASGDVTFTATAAPGISYLLPATTGTDGLLPGLHTLAVSAPGYEPATVNVQVGQASTVTAPTVALAPLATLTGTVTTAVDTVPKDTCVEVFPSDGTNTAPATVPCAPVPGSTTACPVPSGDACALVSPSGLYTVPSLEHGTYWVAVVPSDPDWMPVPPVQIVVAAGDTKVYNATLNRLGQMAITTLVPDQTGQPNPPTTAVTLTYAAAGGTPTSVPAGNGGLKTVTALTPGTYTVTAVTTIGGTQYTAESTDVQVGLNTTTPVTLTLTPQPLVTVGYLQYSLDGTAVPLSGVHATVTVTSGYQGSSAQPSSAPIVTNSQGCFEIVPTGQSPIDAAGCLLKSNPSAGAVATLDMVVPQVIVDASQDANVGKASGWTGYTQTLPATTGFVVMNLTPPDQLVCGQLTADATPVWGQTKVTATSAPAGVDSSGLSITLSGTEPAACASAGVSGAGSGAAEWLVITAPGQPAPNELPVGTYQLLASAPNFDNATASFEVQLGQTAAVGSFELHSDESATVQALDGSFPVTGAVFTLTGPHTSAVTVAAQPGASSVTFTGLSPTDWAGTTPWPNDPTKSGYYVQVQAPGYQFHTFSLLGDTLGAATPIPLDLSSFQLGSVTGSVVGVAGQQTFPLAGIQVQATNGSDTFTAVTDANGDYTITGTAQQEGLQFGTWTVSWDNSAHQPYTATCAGSSPSSPSCTVEVLSPTPATAPALDLAVNNVSGTTVTLSDGNSAFNSELGQATVTLTPTGGGAAVPGTLGTSATAGSFVYTFPDLPPTQYSLSVTAPDHSPLSTTVTLQVGVNDQNIPVTLAAFGNTVSVVLTGQSGANQPVALDSGTVTLTQGSTSLPCSVSTANTYVCADVAAGTWTLTAAASGYLTQTDSLTLTGGQTLLLPITLYTVSGSATVTVDAPAAGHWDGSSVTLSSTTTGVSQPAQPLTNAACGTATCSVAFANLPPGSYTAVVTGPGGSVLAQAPGLVVASSGTVSGSPLTVAVDLATATVSTDSGTATVHVAITTSPGGAAVTGFDVTASSTAVTTSVLVPAPAGSDSYTVTATAPGYQTVTSPMAASGGTGPQTYTATSTLQLSATPTSATVTVDVVTDCAGGWKSPTVTLTPTSSTGSTSSSPTANLSACSGGSMSASFSSVAPGSYIATVYDSGRLLGQSFPTVTPGVSSVTTSITVDVLTVSASTADTQTAAITLSVASGTAATLSSTSSGTTSTATATYLVPAPPQGELYTVTASAPGYATDSTQLASSTVVGALDLSAELTLNTFSSGAAITFTDAAGNALAPGTGPVTLGAATCSVVSGHSNEFTCAEPGPGVYDLSYTAPAGYVATAQQVTVLAGQTTNVTVVLSTQSYSSTVTVTSPVDLGAMGVTVGLVPTSNPSLSQAPQVLSCTGSYTCTTQFTQLAAGSYTATVYNGTTVLGTATATVGGTSPSPASLQVDDIVLIVNAGSSNATVTVTQGSTVITTATVPGNKQATDLLVPASTTAYTVTVSAGGYTSTSQTATFSSTLDSVSLTFSLTASPAPTAAPSTNTLVVTVSCTSPCDPTKAIVTLTAGGQTYSNPTASGSTYTFSDLPAGNDYTVSGTETINGTTYTGTVTGIAVTYTQSGNVATLPLS